MRAFCRACLVSCSEEEERSETVARISRPTVITVSRIIRLKVTTNVKPRRCRMARCMKLGFIRKWEFELGFEMRIRSSRAPMYAPTSSEIEPEGWLELRNFRSWAVDRDKDRKPAKLAALPIPARYGGYA